MQKPAINRHQAQGLSHPSVAAAAQARGLSQHTPFNYLADYSATNSPEGADED